MEQILEQIKVPVIMGIALGATAGIVTHYCAKLAVKNLKIARDNTSAEAEK